MQETSKQMVNHIRIMVEQVEGSARELQVCSMQPLLCMSSKYLS